MSNQVITIDAGENVDQQLRKHLSPGEVWAAPHDNGRNTNIITQPAGSLTIGQQIQLVGFVKWSETRGGPVAGWKKISNGRVVVIDEYFGSKPEDSYFGVQFVK